MTDGIRILVVEDDENVVALLAALLGEEGYRVSSAETAAQARAAIKRPACDLVVLDRTLPDAEGLELLAEIRERAAWKEVPVLLLTAKTSVDDKVAGLRMGGDDYLPKPFDSAELLARIEALLRRSGRLDRPKELEAGGLRVDLEARRAFGRKKEIALWPKEFDLLALLMSNANRVLTREFLLQQVWGHGPDVQLSTKTVDVTVSHLRAKLGALSGRIKSVRGMGYRLDRD